MAQAGFFMFNWRTLGQTGRFKLDLQTGIGLLWILIWILVASLSFV